MDDKRDNSTEDPYERNTEIRRETEIREALGFEPSGTDKPKVTPESDVFKNTPPQSPGGESSREK